MCHHVCNVHVFVVADGGNNGHGTSGDGHGKVIVVEAGQIQFTAAAPQDEDGVVRLFPGLQKRRPDGSGRLFSLHEGFQKVQPESVALRAVQEVVPEILVTGGGFGGDDGQPVRDVRQRQFLLQLHVAGRRKTLDGAPALQGFFSQGKSRVYVVDKKADAVQFAKVHLHTHQHGDAGLKGLACSLLKGLLNAGEVPIPDHGAGFRYGFSAPALAQAQVAMSVGTGTPGTDFRLYPILPREGLGHPFLDAELQLHKVHIIPRFHNFTKIQKIRGKTSTDSHTKFLVQSAE